MLAQQANSHEPWTDDDAFTWRQVRHQMEVLPTAVPARVPPMPDVLQGAQLEDLQSDAESFRSGAPCSERLRSFAHWRAKVTQAEFDSASRLWGLCETARALDRLLGRHPERLALRDAAAELKRHLLARWGVALPVSEDIRRFAARHTRRFDLLPEEWRCL